jgi:hypothetical protein
MALRRVELLRTLVLELGLGLVWVLFFGGDFADSVGLEGVLFFAGRGWVRHG